jgi:hypothetical protein
MARRIRALEAAKRFVAANWRSPQRYNRKWTLMDGL